MSKNEFLKKITYESGVIFRYLSILEKGIKILIVQMIKKFLILEKIFKNNKISSSYRILDNDNIFNSDFL